MTGSGSRPPHGARRRTGAARATLGGVAAVASGLAVAGAPATAQDLSVPKFEIAASPIELTFDVRPNQYAGVQGRRAAWLGAETGEGELWVHPLKLADDFRLDFRIPDYVEPILGRDVARTITVRPELTTIVYSHATFTVTQHLLAPLDEPGLVWLLDVETFRPLEIVGSFQGAFQYAWPGSMGGVYAFWDAASRAHWLSESQRRRNAVIGSPWTRSGSDHPAHNVPDARSTFVIPVDASRAAAEFIPIAAAAGTAPRDSVLATYRRMIGNAEALYRARRAHADALLSGTTSIDTPNDELDLALAWAKVNLDEQVVCNPDLGCGLVAGWGPSGPGTRPGFGWFFGGDAAINSFAMDAVGLWAPTADGLRFLARYQNREDGPRRGKIPHEISQSAATIPWFTDFPYAYYHADTTPYWIVAVWRYWRASGDDALLDTLWPAILEAHRWGTTRDTDGDGIIENGPGNLGAIEVGELGEDIHQDIYLAAVWIESLEALEEMAAARGDRALAADARERRALGLRTLNERYWRSEDGHHAFGIMRSGSTNGNLTVWPATAASFALLEPGRADRTLGKLAADSISTPWGARILSTGSPLYDPMHYNNGAVWPFVTGFVAWGQYAYRRPWAAYPLVDGVAQLTFDWSRGRHPELLSGRYYRPLDTAVPQQFFASSMLVTPALLGMIGWEPDAPRRRATIAPQLPPTWDRVRIDHLRVGDTTLDVDLRQTPSSLEVAVTRAGPPITLTVRLGLPPGARAVTGRPDTFTPIAADGTHAHDVQLESVASLEADTTAWTVRWQGGLSVVAPTTRLAAGQTSGGVRIVDFAFADGQWTLIAEGPTGEREVVQLIGEPIGSASGAELLEPRGSLQRIAIPFTGAGDRATAVVVLEGADPGPAGPG